jgi:hypothetical protein
VHPRPSGCICLLLRASACIRLYLRKALLAEPYATTPAPAEAGMAGPRLPPPKRGVASRCMRSYLPERSAVSARPQRCGRAPAMPAGAPQPTTPGWHLPRTASGSRCTAPSPFGPAQKRRWLVLGAAGDAGALHRGRPGRGPWAMGHGPWPMSRAVHQSPCHGRPSGRAPKDRLRPATHVFPRCHDRAETGIAHHESQRRGRPLSGPVRQPRCIRAKRSGRAGGRRRGRRV